MIKLITLIISCLLACDALYIAFNMIKNKTAPWIFIVLYWSMVTAYWAIRVIAA